MRLPILEALPGIRFSPQIPTFFAFDITVQRRIVEKRTPQKRKLPVPSTRSFVVATGGAPTVQEGATSYKAIVLSRGSGVNRPERTVMSSTPSIGLFMGHAESRAALLHFSMNATYKARLAKAIKQEIAKRVHPDDIRQAIDALLERQLSPALLSRKVEDLHSPKWKGLTEAEAHPDPYEDFPNY
jgi:hypothetical protein